eukprot:Gb_01283 [translate_table: standard]
MCAHLKYINFALLTGNKQYAALAAKKHEKLKIGENKTSIEGNFLEADPEQLDFPRLSNCEYILAGAKPTYISYSHTPAWFLNTRQMRTKLFSVNANVGSQVTPSSIKKLKKLGDSRIGGVKTYSTMNVSCPDLNLVRVQIVMGEGKDLQGEASSLSKLLQRHRRKASLENCLVLSVEVFPSFVVGATGLVEVGTVLCSLKTLVLPLGVVWWLSRRHPFCRWHARSSFSSFLTCTSLGWHNVLLSLMAFVTLQGKLADGD